MKRGDVVGFDYPFSDGSDSKTRPSLVVQSDSLKSFDVILAMISGTESDASVPLLPDAKTGIKKPCYVRCDKLYSIDRKMLYGAVGRLSAQTMRDVARCLKAALGLR